MSDACKTEIMGMIYTHMQDQSKKVRDHMMGLANVVFAAAGNPNKGHKGFMASQVQDRVQQPFRSSLDYDSARRTPVFSPPG